MAKGKYERELKKILEDRGFTVIRSAGSLGEGDLVVLPSSEQEIESMVIEAKSTRDDTYYTTATKREKEQYKRLKQKQKENDNVEHLYFVRWKDRSRKPKIEKWGIFDPTETHIMRKGDGGSLKEVEE